MSLEASLNFAWGAIFFGALVWHWSRERQCQRPRSRSALLLRGLAVFLAALLLFPSVSISDDYASARLLDLNSVSSDHPGLRDGSRTNVQLANQLEETQHIRPVAPFVLVLVQCSLPILPPEKSNVLRPVHLARSLRRAPP